MEVEGGSGCGERDLGLSYGPGFPGTVWDLAPNILYHRKRLSAR